jgi:integrase
MASRARYGSGSVRKRTADRWELRVCVGRDAASGRYRYLSRSVRGSRKDAEAALAVLMAEVASGPQERADVTVQQLVEQWLDLKRETLSITTWEAYAGKAKFRLFPALGAVLVRKLTVHQIDACYRNLVRDEGLSPSTVRQIHNIVVGSLDQAVRWGWRTDNPARLATLPSLRTAEIRPPAPADVMAAIAQADPELATFLRLAAVVAGRRGEVSALRWNAIDLEAGSLLINKALVESKDGTIHEKDTKTHQARRVALDAGTVAVLREWRSQVESRAGECGTELRPDGFVFSSEVDGSTPWRPYRWSSHWTRLRDRIGIDPSIRLHDLRHFAATRLLDAGVPVRTVSGRLGHARAATTLNVYAHFLPATDQLAADVLGALLAPPEDPAASPDITLT